MKKIIALSLALLLSFTCTALAVEPIEELGQELPLEEAVLPEDGEEVGEETEEGIEEETEEEKEEIEEEIEEPLQEVADGLIEDLQPDEDAQALINPGDISFATGANEEKYKKDANGDFDVPSQYVDEIYGISDASFFGVYSGGKWTTKPLLNYSATPAMAEVEERAKAGDYAGAKEALLEERREAAKNYPLAGQTSYNHDNAAYAYLLSKNIFHYESKYVGKVSAGNEFKKVTIDLAPSLSYMRNLSNGIASLYIIAEDKDDTLLEIQGATVSGMAPMIEVLINSESIKIPATESGTIAAGTNRNNTYTNPVLQVKESTSSILKVTGSKLDMNKTMTPVAVDGNTRRAVIKFDLGRYMEAGSSFESATLTLYVRNASGTGDKNLIVFSKDLNWSASSLKWSGFEHSILNFDGEPFIRMNNFTADKFSTETHTARQRAKYQANLANHYKSTTDPQEKEDIAHTAITQMCSFLDYVGGCPVVQTNSGTSTKERRNMLDIGDFGRVPVLNFITFINSEHMTPEVYTGMAKFVYRTGAHLNSNTNWGNNNWISIISQGFFYMNLFFPIYSTTDTWMKTVSDKTYNASLVGADGSSIEGSQDYAKLTVSPFFAMYEMALKYGEKNPLNSATLSQIERVIKYRTYYSPPGFRDPQFGDGYLARESYTRPPSIQYGILLNSPELMWLSDPTVGTPPVFTSHSYPKGSHEYIMRTGWGDKDMYGYIGMRAGWSSHTHFDDMQFVFHDKGTYLLTDQAYLGDNSKHSAANWVKSNEAHNTVVIDGQNQKAHISATGTNPNIEHNFTTTGAYDYFRGTSKMNTNADHTRGVMFIRGKYVILNDYLKPVNSASHTYTQLWHMLPDSGIYLDENDGSFRSNFKDVNVRVIPVNRSAYSSTVIKEGWCRGTGGNGQSSPYGSFQIKSAGNVSFETVIISEDLSQSLSIDTEKLSVAGITNNAAVAMNVYVEDAANPNETFSATYYTMNDTAQRKTVRVGNYTFDGTMSYVERGADGLISAMYLQDETKRSAGIELVDNLTGNTLFKSTAATPSVAIEISNKTAYLYSDTDVDPMANTIKYNDLPLDNLTFYVTIEMEKVYLNDIEIPFNQSGNYIYFGNKLIEGAPITDGGSATPPPSSTGSGHGSISTGGSSSVSSGGTSGGTVGGGVTTPVIPVNPSGGNSAAEKELENHWAKEEILELVEKGVVNGSGASLNLSDSIKRAEFAALLVRALKIPVPAVYTLDLADVSQGSWYATLVQAAIESGISIPDGGYMRPDDLITREEMAAMIMRCYRILEEKASLEQEPDADGEAAAEQAQELDALLEELERAAENEGDAPPDDEDAPEEAEPIPLADFTDMDSISDWALADVLECREKGFITGFPDGEFKPKQYALREQAMVMIYRLITN